jgi:hypothetical protein
VIRRAVAGVLLGGCGLALVGAGSAGREQLPGVARGTALCPRPIALRLEFGAWSEPRPGSPHEFYAAVWTRGGRGAGGLDIYATATAAAPRINRLCRRIVQRGRNSSDALRAPLFYRFTDSLNAYFVDAAGTETPASPTHRGGVNPIADRQAFGLRFQCDVAQRVVVHTHALAGQAGHYLSVRTQRSRKLLAVAILRQSGDSSFRISRSCRPD